MTREEVCKLYKVDEHGRIRSPGKFEGEMLYAPHFYDQMLLGMQDDREGGEDEVDVFFPSDEDHKEFPELKGVKKVYMREDEQGFVNVWTR